MTFRALNRIHVPNGTDALPSMGFSGDPDTGIYWVAANEFGVTAGGSRKLSIKPGEVQFHDHLVMYVTGKQIRASDGSDSKTAPSYSWNGDTDTGMYSSNTNEITFSAGDNDRMRINTSVVQVENCKLTGGGSGITDPTTDADVGDRGYNDIRYLDLAINNETASYIAALTDRGNMVEMNVGTANNFTIPPNTDVAFPVGTVLTVVQQGAGATTIVQGSGVTINQNSTYTKVLDGQYAMATLIQATTDAWYLSGDLGLA